MGCWKQLVCCALLATALPSTHLTTKTLKGTICKIDAQHFKMDAAVQIHNIGEKSAPAPPPQARSLRGLPG